MPKPSKSKKGKGKKPPPPPSSSSSDAESSDSDDERSYEDAPRTWGDTERAQNIEKQRESGALQQLKDQALDDLSSDDEDAGNASVGRIKKKFDEKWSPYWHVVVGRSYGAFATHETRHFCSFKVDNFAVMMYKTA